MTKPLTARDLETLGNLAPTYSDDPRQWLRPLDIGGGSRSHHSGTLAKLEKRGLAESRQRSSWGSSRGSKEYRITDAGWIEVLAQGALKFPNYAEWKAWFDTKRTRPA